MRRQREMLENTAHRMDQMKEMSKDARNNIRGSISHHHHHHYYYLQNQIIMIMMNVYNLQYNN